MKRLLAALNNYCSVLPGGQLFGAFLGVFGGIRIYHYIKSKFPDIPFLVILFVDFFVLLAFAFLISFILHIFGVKKSDDANA